MEIGRKSQREILLEHEKKMLLNLLNESQTIIEGSLSVVSEEITASIEEFRQNLNNITDGVTEIADAAVQLNESMLKQNEALNAILEDQENITSQSKVGLNQLSTLQTNISSLTELTANLKTMVEDNLNISDRLHLISINGAIESARVGSVIGAAFGIIAKETRELSEQAAKIINKQNDSIDVIIHSIEQNSLLEKGVSSELEKTLDTILLSGEQLKNLQTELTVIATSSEELSATVTEFSGSLHEMKAAIDSIMDHIVKFHNVLKEEFDLNRKAAFLSTNFRAIGSTESSLQRTSERIVEFLTEEFVDDQGNSQLALARIFITLPFKKLPPSYQEEFDGPDVTADSIFLCLMGTAGLEPQWNHVSQSVGHKAVLLPATAEELELIPMIAEMFKSMNVDYRDIVHPQERSDVNIVEGYMLVENAVGSPFIPAQEDFIVKYGIKSELGMGGFLPSGSVFTCFLFFKELIIAKTAEKFKILPLALQQALMKFDLEGRYWKERLRNLLEKVS